MPREIPEFKPSQERVIPRDETEASIQPISMKDEEVAQVKLTLKIKPENAHSQGLNFLSSDIFINKVKPMIGEKLVRHEQITRLDKLKAETSDVIDLTREHIIDIEHGKFMCFDIVRDGNDVALSFTKRSGEAGLRPLDNEILAELLNRVLVLHPELIVKNLGEDNFVIK